MSADSFGTAPGQLAAIPLTPTILDSKSPDHDRLKAEYVTQYLRKNKLNCHNVAVLGNGNNDRVWLQNVKDGGGLAIDLLRENSVRGYEVEAEKNPRRPVATTDRYKKLRAVSDQVCMARWRQRRSYLSELLDIVHGTGRRISAVVRLRYEDLRPAKTKTAPHGAIQWPGETDKMGKAWAAPISPQVRTALNRVLRERPGIGTAYLFPSPTNPNVPVSKDLASAWLERAERLANLPKQCGSLWHAYRRGWVTARKHLPDADVAAAGGWEDITTLKTCYQQPDDKTILAVVLGGRELREQHA